MASKNKMVMTNNFKVAAKAGHEAIEFAILAGTNEMRDKTKERIDQGASSRGYRFNSSSVRTEVSPMRGKVIWPEWWARFFEYGTMYIPAMPALRPGQRAGRKVVLAVLGKDFEKWIRRRARVR